VERRTFIIGAIAGGIGLAEYSYVTGWMNHLQDPKDLSVKAYEKYGARAALVAITPNEDFYVTSKGFTPHVKLADWRLKFNGLVERPLTFDYQELLALPKIEKDLTLECISNPIGGKALGNAKWTGTPLKPLVERAKPAAEAAYVVIHAADGFTTGHPLERIRNDENFIAYQMNGADLLGDHGYPARVFIPGKFGMKQPKWATRFEFVNHAYLGYWETSGWSDTCERLAHARFSDLKDGAKISGKNFELTGYALGNLDGIKAVELSFDGGSTWQRASIFSNPSALTWVFWKYIWLDPKPGKYALAVRAVDGKGQVESSGPRGIFPNGATGYQTRAVVVA
jgi:DMSO/TMAO reductase YedYZ molybdopterin-dependent catalytic subunit